MGSDPPVMLLVGAQAKFWNPTTTPSGILVSAVRKEEKLLPKIESAFEEIFRK